MSVKNIRAVIGKGFGDEGKGLCVDYFCAKEPDSLVIKHNGGAQSGHTVETGDKRFIFHQLSAGSFRRSDTFWAETYYPDLYKLGEEISEFYTLTGFTPRIYADININVTILDDVLINMLLETMRADKRHGSCGMGINEAYLRSNTGYGIKISELFSSSAEDLVRKISSIREEYVRERLLQEGINLSDNSSGNEYLEMLSSKVALDNFVDEMMRNAEQYVTPIGDVKALLEKRESIIFETGQGLLLDADYERYSPHLTMSKTGLTNSVNILNKHNMLLTEAVYVTRSYVTRHGAGPLPYECDETDVGVREIDKTNIQNEWQGSIRYARHGSYEEFVSPVADDVNNNIGDNAEMSVSLFITHLNETDDKICMTEGDVDYKEFLNNRLIRDTFDMFYLSDDRESTKTKIISK